MIKTEKITLNEKEYTRTWSDNHMMIERDGSLYEEAIDPIDSGRTYTETNQEIIEVFSDEIEAKARAYDIITGVSI